MQMMAFAAPSETSNGTPEKSPGPENERISGAGGQR